MKVFAIDLSVCNGCYCCQIACKDEHVSNDWTPYAKPQPDIGQFWLKLDEEVRGQVPKVLVAYTPLLCNHCDDAPCISGCESKAIYKRDDGLVIIDPETCTGCKLCEDNCPYGAIYFNQGFNIAQKCTGCAHLLDNDDGWEVPRCVDQCPTGALQFGEESEFADFIKDAEIRNPEAGTKPRVYYKHLPKAFVGGTLYDPVEKEVVIGATCTLKDDESSEEFTATTNHFGDFWFRGLKDDRTFSLLLEKDGRKVSIDDIRTDQCRSLGDIPLQ